MGEQLGRRLEVWEVRWGTAGALGIAGKCISRMFLERKEFMVSPFKLPSLGTRANA